MGEIDLFDMKSIYSTLNEFKEMKKHKNDADSMFVDVPSLKGESESSEYDDDLFDSFEELFEYDENEKSQQLEKKVSTLKAKLKKIMKSESELKK